jgi:hypothetical protein
MKTITLPLLLLSAPFFTGCTPLGVQNRLSSPNSPANAHASEALEAPAAPMLMTGNNYAMSPEAEGTEMEMGEHGGHGSPAMKMPQHQGHNPNAAPKPSEHDHHEQNQPK